MILSILLAALAAAFAYVVYLLVVAPKLNPLQHIAGPPARGWFKNHLRHVLK